MISILRKKSQLNLYVKKKNRMSLEIVFVKYLSDADSTTQEKGVCTLDKQARITKKVTKLSSKRKQKSIN